MTPEEGMKEGAWGRGRKRIEVMQRKGEKLPLAVQTYMRMCSYLSFSMLKISFNFR